MSLPDFDMQKNRKIESSYYCSTNLMKKIIKKELSPITNDGGVS